MDESAVDPCAAAGVDKVRPSVSNPPSRIGPTCNRLSSCSYNASSAAPSGPTIEGHGKGNGTS